MDLEVQEKIKYVLTDVKLKKGQLIEYNGIKYEVIYAVKENFDINSSNYEVKLERV